jgi:steroid delta-isomerase-like uncharacterized protein
MMPWISSQLRWSCSGRNPRIPETPKFRDEFGMLAQHFFTGQRFAEQFGIDRRRKTMTSHGNMMGAAPTASLSSEALVEVQRKTIEEHVRTEQIKDWPGVYRTFTPHSENAYYDVVPFQTRFRKMQGVIDFYEAFTRGFPDFQITVHTEQDVPGVSIREAQIIGTHNGEYCGIPATGRRVSVPLMAFFLFDKRTGHLEAERIYFDNNTILAQIRGELSPNDVFDLGRIERDAGGGNN